MPSKLPRPGDLLAGRYQITSVLGRGGFGTVYRAHQLSVGRDVALKCMTPEMAQDPNNIERFRREALHISQLRHPNTVTLYDYGQTDEGLFYIVLELVEGRSLALEIEESRGLGSERGVHIFLQICESLAEAHRHGIVHRDLKPENILLCEMHGDRDYVKVLDFGLAKAMSWSGMVEARLTAQGKVFGTPMYMAPEQVCGEEVTTATDVYALGLLLFEVLTGELPVPGKTRLKVLRAQLNDPVPALPPVLERHGLGEVIRRCAQKEPAARYADASALLESIKRVRWDGEALPPGLRVASDVEEPEAISTRETREVRAQAPAPRPLPPPPLGASAAVHEATTEVSDVAASPGARGSAAATVEVPSPDASAGLSERAMNREASCREAELAALESWTHELGSPEGARVLLCTGEPGAGKSRLIERWATRLGDQEAALRVAWGRGVCRPASPHPLSAVREAIREAQGRLPAAEASAWASGRDGSQEVARAFLGDATEEMSPRLLTGLGRALAAASVRRPIVLVLDDVEHAGAGLCALIEHLTTSWARGGAAVGWLLTGRAEGVMHNAELRGLLERLAGREMVEVRLERLERARCDAFVEALLPCDAEVRSRLYALSQGTPMFVVQIVRFLLGSGQLIQGEDGRWQLASGASSGLSGVESQAPQDLLELLALRIDRVVERHPERPGLRVLLQWLALLGQRTPLGLLSMAMGLGGGSEVARRLLGDIEVLERGGLVRALSGGLVEFDHVLVREALLREVAGLRAAARWHMRASGARLDWASRTGAAPPYLEIAHHYRLAGDAGAYQSFLLRAGEQARAALERRQARAIYEELARDPGEDPRLQAEVWGALGELCESLGELGPAEDYYRLAAEASLAQGALLASLRSQRGRARVLLQQHRVASARPLAEAACAAARGLGDATALVEGLDVLAEVTSRVGDVASCDAALQEAVGWLDAVEDAGVRGRLWLRVSEVSKRAGDAEAQATQLQRALLEFEQADDLQGRSDVLAALGFHLVERGEHERAALHLEKALEIKELIADRQGVAQVLSHMGMNAMRRGDVARAEELLGRSVATFRAMGAGYHLASALINLGLLHSNERRYAEADACYEEALGRLVAVGDRVMASLCLSNRGIVALNQGEVDQARALFREALRFKKEAGSQWGMLGVMANLAFVAAWDGELEVASRLYRQLLEGEPAPTDAAVLQALLGVLELYTGGDGAARIEAGWQLASSSGVSPVVALCRAALGLLRLSQGRQGEAEAILADLRPRDVLGAIEPTTWLAWLDALAAVSAPPPGLLAARRLLGEAWQR